ncbi:Soluble hydrogenase 42 kDa subunit [Roseovarius albus]|uniref:Soluble hydrogenase 42 kDa subunit n=1 Tax=Roseovarius albus TaxID=1247867 RepID=A0A1X6Y962_9RHOB|nr:aminotransferase class V-fold PLP-dependent enzyme [Roseovarius albus]SLN13727.1 Soluble hydrogenase 42 kDa subunit [Roseovarius albus]
MNLSQGRSYLAIPGPSVMPDEVLNAMHHAAPNIYGSALNDLAASLARDLKKVARTEGQVAMYISNGHGAWEAALANLFTPGDKVLVLATGRFGHGWGEMATALGLEVQVEDFGKSSAVDMDRFRALLQSDSSHGIKAVLVPHVDTSTSVRNDVAAMRATLDELKHPALFMVDCIASLGCDRFEMDAWGVDVMVSACQKGLMVPPGLGFVFYSDKAAAIRASMERVSKYWDWQPRSDPKVFYQFFGGTAPTHHMFGLRKALDMILEEGMEHVWKRHEMLANAIWAACKKWSDSNVLWLNVDKIESRSNAVTLINLNAPDGARVRDWVERTAGLTLGIGLGMESTEDPNADGYFRIGHMGHVNAHMILGVLGTIDAALKALDIPHGEGALEAAARELSR